MTWKSHGPVGLLLLAATLAAAGQAHGAFGGQPFQNTIVNPQVQPDQAKDKSVFDQKSDAKEESIFPPKAVPQTEIQAPQAFIADPTIQPCDPCFFVNANYLLWWMRRGPMPPLLTTSTATDSTAGLLGQPGTIVLIGQDGINYGTFSGIRIGAGWNLGADRFWGIEAGGIVLQPRTVKFETASDPNGNPLLIRPFSATIPATVQGNVPVFQGGVAVALPDQLRGDLRADSSSRFWGYEANLVAHSVREECRRVDLLCGFRSLGLTENLRIDEELRLLVDGASLFQSPPVGEVTLTHPIISPPAGSLISAVDAFDTRNRFYGGQLGGRFEWNWGRLGLDLTGKLALGVTQQSASAFGLSTLVQPASAPSPPILTEGGVLALVSNVGVYERNVFSVVPEVSLAVHFDIATCLRARIGYSGLYWSHVARPGQQIDIINPKLVPSGVDFTQSFDPTTEQARPRFLFADNGFWLHGLDFGIELRF